MRKTYKKLICLCAVLVFCLSLIPVTAFAQDPFTGVAIGITGSSGAGLFGSMAAASGINISYTSDPVNDAMWNKLNPDSVYFNGEKHEASNIGADIYDYINVDIGDWLQAQNDFIKKFVNEYSVIDNDSGSITTERSVNGVPLSTQLGINNFGNPSVNDYISNYGLGYFTFRITAINGNTCYYTLYNTYNNTTTQVYQGNASIGQLENMTYYTILSRSNFIIYANFYINNTPWHNKGLENLPVTPASNISYTSSNVNTAVFNGYGSAKVKIPSGTLQSGWTIDDFCQELNNIWSNGNEYTIIIEDGYTPVPPTPIPIPTTSLGDVPADEWMDFYGQRVLDNQDDIINNVNDIPGLINDTNDYLENIDQNVDEATETLESIDTNIGVGNGILGGIRTVINNIASDISSIKQGILDLINEIVLATENLIAGILNQIPVVFGVIFTPFKQASSIWHYVVEWVQSISAPFSWIRTVATGTSYYIILPVYASLAGTVVLAFFKRFGR